MKAWKASSFKVPYLLSKGSNLGGSSHDKDKEVWEAKRKSLVSLLQPTPS